MQSEYDSSDWEEDEEEGVCCSDERFARRLWQEILKKKGLPSNTPYVFIPDDDFLYKKIIPKDEDVCDRLMRKIRAKKLSAKTSPSSSSSKSSTTSSSTLTSTTTTTTTSSECSTDEDEEIERKRKKKRDKNRKKRENKKRKKKAATARQD